MGYVKHLHAHHFIDDMHVQLQKIKNKYYPDPRIDWSETDKYINYMLEDIWEDGEPEDWLVELGMDFRQAIANVDRVKYVIDSFTRNKIIEEPPTIVDGLLIIKERYED